MAEIRPPPPPVLLAAADESKKQRRSMRISVMRDLKAAQKLKHTAYAVTKRHSLYSLGPNNEDDSPPAAAAAPVYSSHHEPRSVVEPYMSSLRRSQTYVRPAAVRYANLENCQPPPQPQQPHHSGASSSSSTNGQSSEGISSLGYASYKPTSSSTRRYSYLFNY